MFSVIYIKNLRWLHKKYFKSSLLLFFWSANILKIPNFINIVLFLIILKSSLFKSYTSFHPFAHESLCLYGQVGTKRWPHCRPSIPRQHGGGHNFSTKEAKKKKNKLQLHRKMRHSRRVDREYEIEASKSHSLVVLRGKISVKMFNLLKEKKIKKNNDRCR